jgi:hypothetical protein
MLLGPEGLSRPLTPESIGEPAREYGPDAVKYNRVSPVRTHGALEGNSADAERRKASRPYDDVPELRPDERAVAVPCQPRLYPPGVGSPEGTPPLT